MFEEYKYRIELHNHTYRATNTASVSPEWVVRKYKEMGYDAVVFTNKISYKDVVRKGYDYSFERYRTDYDIGKAIGDEIGIKVIEAMEVTVAGSGRDYLVYGVDRSVVEKALNHIDEEIPQFYKTMSDGRTLILQAHPFRPDETKAPRDCIDGMEVFNMHPEQNSRVGIAARYALNNEFNIIIGGSDTHNEGDECCISMLSKTLPEDSFELADILRSGDYLFEIEGNIVIPYTFTGKI